MGTVHNIFLKKAKKTAPDFFVGCCYIRCLRSKVVYNEPLAHHHGGQLCLGGISGL